jgi:hypothetical protein
MPSRSLQARFRLHTQLRMRRLFLTAKAADRARCSVRALFHGAMQICNLRSLVGDYETGDEAVISLWQATFPALPLSLISCPCLSIN